MPSYTTIAAPVSAEVEIRRSRFIAFLEPASDEDAARAAIARVAAAHPRARHHCTAFVLGARQQVQRTNDDGEPAGTAGTPILETLLAAGLSDVVAVVVRYFGGVLLGAAGLTRAYRSAVAGALADASLRVREFRLCYCVTLGHAEAPLVEADARRRDWSFSAVYGAEVSAEIAVAPEQAAALVARLAELTAGRAVPVARGELWVDVPAAARPT